MVGCASFDVGCGFYWLVFGVGYDGFGVLFILWLLGGLILGMLFGEVFGCGFGVLIWLWFWFLAWCLVIAVSWCGCLFIMDCIL